MIDDKRVFNIFLNRPSGPSDHDTPAVLISRGQFEALEENENIHANDDDETIAIQNGENVVRKTVQALNFTRSRRVPLVMDARPTIGTVKTK